MFCSFRLALPGHSHVVILLCKLGCDGRMGDPTMSLAVVATVIENESASKFFFKE